MGIEHSEHKKRIEENLRGVLEIYEEMINDIANPADANPQTIYDYQKQKMMVEKCDVRLTPGEHLIALDELEKWFTSRNISYPLPARIQEQRDFWKSKLVE